MNRYKDTEIMNLEVTDRYKDRTGNVQKYQTTLYDIIPELNSDLYVIAQEGDRLDNLAFQYYGDSSLWWFLARANNIKTINIPAGTSLRVPATIENAKGS